MQSGADPAHTADHIRPVHGALFPVASAWQKKIMTDSAPSLRSRIKSDLIALGSLSFMAGSFAITAAVLVRSDRLGWVYAATAVICVGGALFVGRRIFSRVP